MNRIYSNQQPEMLKFKMWYVIAAHVLTIFVLMDIGRISRRKNDGSVILHVGTASPVTNSHVMIPVLRVFTFSLPILSA